MVVSELIEDIKPLVNYEFDIKVKETLDYPYDFVRAISYAVRKIAKETNSFKKSILIPIISGITDYKLELGKYTKDSLEFVTPTNYAVLAIDNSVTPSCQGIKKITEKNIEDIDILENPDTLAIGLRQLGKDLFLKFNTLFTSATVQGTFDKLTAVGSSTVELYLSLGTDIGDVIFNLDKSDIALIDSATIIAGATNPFTITPDKLELSGLLSWEVNDKVYISDSLEVFFLLLTFKALPLITYFDSSLSTAIPLAEADLDDIKHIAISRLYEILVSRFPEQAKIFDAKVKLGLTKPEKQVVSEIRRRINTTAQPIKAKGFNIVPNTYGR